MTNTEGQTDCQCSFLVRAGWFATRFDKSELSPIFLAILGWMMFHSRKVGGFAPTCREPPGRAIGMMEYWNIGKMGRGILHYWVNGKIRFDDKV